MNTHPRLTEDSRSHSLRTHVGTHDRKGREGKGREKEGKSSLNQVQNVKAVTRAAASFGFGGIA